MTIYQTIVIEERIERNATAYPCPCGGYADEVEVTDEEDTQHGCGRHHCCSAAFVCRVCGKRLVGSREAPEME